MNGLIFVTGAAGFLGSHLAERLVEMGESVRGFDNLSTGRMDNLARAVERSNFEFTRGDCLNHGEVLKALAGVRHVFHLAADPEVRRGVNDPQSQFRQNVLATQLLLEQVRRVGSLDTFVLASTSTVYGNATKLPTPEDYGPLCPISTYGATKLACEALCSSYASSYGFRAIILRLANIVGPRSSHGVIHDFLGKIKANPNRLEVLGDGTQTKSYLHVSDCVDAMVASWQRSAEGVNILNVGSHDCIDVATIAHLVIRETNAKAQVEFVGGTSTGAGWIGDVKKMWLDVGGLNRLGWHPTLNSLESITRTLREIFGRNPP